MYVTYSDIIDFCSKLTIPQLMTYRDLYKRFKSREYLVAREVLRIRLNNKRSRITF